MNNILKKKFDKDNKEKILIFYQSISEIRLIIQLLHENPFGNCIIIITGGKHFLRVLKKLKIKKYFGVEIYLFSGLSLKNPFNLILMYRNFYFSKKTRILKKYIFKKAFFFTEYEDFVAPIFLSKLKIKKIILLNNYKNIFSNKKFKPSFAKKIKILFIKFLLIHIKIKISYHSFKFFTKNDSSNLQFPRYKILNIKVYQKNQPSIKFFPEFQLNLSKKILKKKNIMYVDSNDEEIIGDNFKKIIFEIFDIFKKCNYNIIVKRPTRECLSPSLENINYVNYIYDSTPIEMYNLDNISFVFGFMTTALSKIQNINQNIKVFSIINLLPEVIKKDYAKSILNFHKNIINKKSKIFFPIKLKQIKKLALMN